MFSHGSTISHDSAPLTHWGAAYVLMSLCMHTTALMQHRAKYFLYQLLLRCHIQLLTVISVTVEEELVHHETENYYLLAAAG